MGKLKITVTDQSVFVSCEDGVEVGSPLSNAWLLVLGAIAFPNEHTVSIMDKRKSRPSNIQELTKT
jgi:hypothetical protein